MTNTEGSMPRLIGTLRASDAQRGVVRVEDVYDTDIDDLWSALTEPDRLARWVAVVDGDFRVGGEIHLRFTSTWEGPGRIEVCDAPTRLLVRMEPGTEDETVVEALLVAEGDKTRLVVEDRDLPLADLPAHGAGWQVHLEDLATYITGNEPESWRDRWTALRPAYGELAIGES